MSPRPRPVLREVAALVYLAVCAALLVWALISSATSDESMAGVIPLLALPDGTAMVVLAVAIGALANAAAIGWCARALRRGRG